MAGVRARSENREGIDDICTSMKMSKTTLYRYVALHGGRLARPVN